MEPNSPNADQASTEHPPATPASAESSPAAPPSTTNRQEALDVRAREYRQLLNRKIRRMYPFSVILFVAAVASTWYVGGPLYAAGVMGILLAHELGHFIQARRYHVPASPPMFIPMPFMMLGTMGAVIIQGAGFANRKALFDIAITGPLAGLVLAIPVAWYGLQDSRVVTVDPYQGAFILGDPLILEWMYEARHGELASNQEVELNPLLFAGWVGIFITALNLVPIGQLDGGHILYTLIGRKAHWVAYGIIAGAVSWMVSRQDPSFALMLGLLIAFGVKHPPSADDSAEIGPVRVVLGWLTLAFVLIGFTPVPITIEPGQPQPQPTQPAPANGQPGLQVNDPTDAGVQGQVWTIPMRPADGQSDAPAT